MGGGGGISFWGTANRSILSLSLSRTLGQILHYIKPFSITHTKHVILDEYAVDKIDTQSTADHNGCYFTRAHWQRGTLEDGRRGRGKGQFLTAVSVPCPNGSPFFYTRGKEQEKQEEEEERINAFLFSSVPCIGQQWHIDNQVDSTVHLIWMPIQIGNTYVCVSI